MGCSNNILLYQVTVYLPVVVKTKVNRNNFQKLIAEQHGLTFVKLKLIIWYQCDPIFFLRLLFIFLTQENNIAKQRSIFLSTVNTRKIQYIYVKLSLSFIELNTFSMTLHASSAIRNSNFFVSSRINSLLTTVEINLHDNQVILYSECVMQYSGITLSL